MAALRGHNKRMNHKKNAFGNLDDKHSTKICQQLKKREAQWWSARQRLVTLKQRQVFWFSENSSMMWLLWQLVGYVIVAIAFMLVYKILNTKLSLKDYMSVFILQTLFYITIFAFRGSLKNRLNNKIYRADMQREQALNEMIILASDSIYPTVHTGSAISLKSIHEQHKEQLRLASLHCLLNIEVAAGRLILQQHTKADILPLELADEELSLAASRIIYKSVI